MASDKAVVLSDATSVRALAHPARVAVIEELYSGGRELTATECAEVAGLSPSAMSYHLRNLERAGIVERAESTGDGRERPWRAAGAYIRVDSETMRNPAAGAALTSTLIARLADQHAAWVRRERSEPREWRLAAIMTNAQVWLLPEELTEIDEMIDAAITKYRDRRTGTRPAGSRRVRFAAFAFPNAPPPAEHREHDQ
jgi:DNA-binding transcriptional ArsR family regulator